MMLLNAVVREEGVLTSVASMGASVILSCIIVTKHSAVGMQSAAAVGYTARNQQVYELNTMLACTTSQVPVARLRASAKPFSSTPICRGASIKPSTTAATRIPNNNPSTPPHHESKTSTSMPSAAVLAAGLVLATAAGSLLVAEPVMAHSLSQQDMPTAHIAMEQFQLAEGGQEFWSNLARYGRYFVTVMLGTGYVMLRPLTAAFKNPLTAILSIAGIVGTAYFVKFTLDAMLGLDSVPFDYVQGEF